MAKTSFDARRQLALNIRLRDEATLENFLTVPATAPLLASLEAQLGAGGEALLYLFGPADSGRSHLLQAACHRAGAGALYLPLAELADCEPGEVLRDVEGLRLVCLDDVHSVLGAEHWEHALFHLFNRARERSCRLLVSGDAAPRALPVRLADLRSRLSWGVVYQLQGPDDAHRCDVLVFRAGRRGLQMSGEVARYLVHRAPRGMSHLLALLEQLDAASLAEQRALSIPFVKRILGW